MTTTKLFQNGFSDISLIISRIKIVPKCGNGRYIEKIVRNDFVTLLKGVDQNHFAIWSWSKSLSEKISSHALQHRLDVTVKWLLNSKVSFCVLQQITIYELSSKSVYFRSSKVWCEDPLWFFFDLLNFEIKAPPLEKRMTSVDSWGLLITWLHRCTQGRGVIT